MTERKILGTVVAIEGTSVTVHVPTVERRISNLCPWCDRVIDKVPMECPCSEHVTWTIPHEETDEEFRERLRSMFERPSEEQT